MIEKKHVDRLRFHLQRLFCMKVSRTTFRELQNAVLASVEGDRDLASKLFETLLRGEIPPNLADKESDAPLRWIVDNYCIPCRLSRDVYERGEYIQVITSDVLQQNDMPMFVNRIRRIDGEELQFLSDLESSLHLVHHFVSRLSDLSAEESTHKSVKDVKKDLSQLRQGVEALLSKLDNSRVGSSKG